MDIKTIFLGVNLAKEAAAYFGLIETLNTKIDSLKKSELEAGIRSLNQAVNSISERPTPLREARARFNKAASLESNERLAICYLGLALCHKNLGDDTNFINALRSITNTELKGEAMAYGGAIAEHLFLRNPHLSFFKLVFGLPQKPTKSLTLWESRKSRLDQLKSSAQSYVNQLTS